MEKKFNFVSSLSNRSYTDLIVIHHTGGARDIDASAEQIHDWHISAGFSGIGYHFVIRKDGTIERGRPINAVGSHAFGSNAHSIGIHLSGNFEITHPTMAQSQLPATKVASLGSEPPNCLDTADLLSADQ